ncbi:MAG: GAF domain-containing protein [Anaerolineae bacterium]|nr:GAF domain-containing protein [Anaerolineae bacterium]
MRSESNEQLDAQVERLQRRIAELEDQRDKHHMQLLEAEAYRRREAETLRAATQALSATLDLQQIFDLILQELEKVVPYDSASVQQLDGNHSQIIGGRGFPNPNEIIGLRFDITKSDNPNSKVVCRRASVILDDASMHYAEFRRHPHAPAQIHSWLGVPLLFGERLIGMLALDKREVAFYNQEHAHLAMAFAAQAAVAIENARLVAAERKQLRLAQTLQQVGALPITQMSLTDVFEQLFDLLAQVIEYDTVALHLLDQEGQLYLGAGRGFPDIELAKTYVRRYSSETLAEPWLHSGTLVIPDTRLEARWRKVPGLDYIRSWMGCALYARDRLVGILNVDSITPNAYDEAMGKTVTAFANQAAVAIENSQLYERAQHEIAERKRAEESLRISESQYRTTLDAMQDIIHVVDVDLRITLANKALERWLESVGQEVNVIGENLFQVFPFLPEKVRDAYLEIFCKGEVESVQEHAIINGTEYYTESLRIPVFDRDRVTRVVTVIHDITQQKSLEEQFRQAQKMEIFGRLAGGVAHDFNNLLTAITGNTELLLRNVAEDHPDFVELDEIRKAAYRAAQVARQLLVFSRKEALEPQILAIDDIVTDVERMLLRLIGEDILLEPILESQTGYIQADRGQIEQVILNLVVNARDAMPQGGKLTIRTENVDLQQAYTNRFVDLQPGSYVVVSVSDTGIGITPEIQNHLFEPFFTTKEAEKGTGLGLATVYWIVVQQSNGQIDVQSRPGKGSTFQIYLPRVQAPDGDSNKQPADQITPGSETILLVEDEDMVRRLARRILLQCGYTVLDARNGHEAISTCKQHPDPIHLLITDIVMPYMSGRELAERLMPIRPNMKVLYVSGHTDDAIVRHGVERSEIAFLQKPFTLHSLTHKVRQVLGEIQTS